MLQPYHTTYWGEFNTSSVRYGSIWFAIGFISSIVRHEASERKCGGLVFQTIFYLHQNSFVLKRTLTFTLPAPFILAYLSTLQVRAGSSAQELARTRVASCGTDDVPLPPPDHPPSDYDEDESAPNKVRF